MDAPWSPTVPAKVDAAFCCGLAKALLQAAASGGGAAGSAPPALSAAECLKLLKAAEKLLKAEPTLVRVSPSTQPQEIGLACWRAGGTPVQGQRRASPEP